MLNPVVRIRKIAEPLEKMSVFMSDLCWRFTVSKVTRGVRGQNQSFVYLLKDATEEIHLSQIERCEVTVNLRRMELWTEEANE